MITPQRRVNGEQVAHALRNAPWILGSMLIVVMGTYWLGEVPSFGRSVLASLLGVIGFGALYLSWTTGRSLPATLLMPGLIILGMIALGETPGRNLLSLRTVQYFATIFLVLSILVLLYAVWRKVP